MVLASLRPPHPLVDPDDVNTPNSKNIQWLSFKFGIRLDTLRYPNCISGDNFYIPQIFEMPYIHN